MERTPAKILSAHRGYLLVFRIQENLQAAGALWDSNERMTPKNLALHFVAHLRGLAHHWVQVDCI